MAPIITSVRNPSVKDAVQLHRKKNRQESGLILVEGQNCLEEAAKAGLHWEAIYQREDAEIRIHLPMEPTLVTEEVMAKMATTESPPPLLGVARYRMTEGQQFNPAHTASMLGLYELQDPGNVGTLIRTACAFGVTAMVLIGTCADPTNPKVIRSSLGMVFRLPWYSFDNLETLQDAAKAVEGLTLWGADAHRGQRFDQVHYGDKSMLILGSEAHGMPESPSVQSIHIPMNPDVESLNVAMAGAIVLCQFWMQKRPQS